MIRIWGDFHPLFSSSKKSIFAYMKKHTRLVFISAITLAMTVFSCKKEFNDRSCESPSQVDCNSDTTKVNVRIVNLTGFPLCDFTVIFDNGTKTPYIYGTLGAGETSCYTTLSSSLLYPEVTYNLGAGEFKIQDSLTRDPYNTQRLTTPGFYSYFVNTVLEDTLVITTLIQDEL